MTFRAAGAFPMLCCLVMAIWSSPGGAADPTIPLRVPRVKIGDWVTFRQDGVVSRHTVTGVERTEAEVFVHCRIEILDESGTVSGAGRTMVAGIQEREVAAIYARVFSDSGMSGAGETLTIAGKAVPAVVFRHEGTGEAYWFSDAVGILGLVRYEPGGGAPPVYETLDFGGGEGGAG